MKKIISVILVAVMTVFAIGIVLARDKFYNDNRSNETSSVPPSSWAEESVEKAKILSFLDDEEYYNYGESITREEFCELIYKYYKKSKKSDNVGVDEFKKQLLDEMNTIKEKTKFASDDYLTREEAAVILFWLVDKVHPEWGANEIYYEFKDNEDISDWAIDAIQKICNMGIMDGVDVGKFDPKANLTVEQAITVIVRVHDGFLRVDGKGHDFADIVDTYMPEDENYMFSPLSIKMALAMAANGAEGETKQEILDVVGIEDLELYNEDAKNMINKYSQSDLLNLDVSNSVWINADNTSQRFSKDYSDKVEKYFDAESGIVTNKNAVEKINRWVDNKTNGKVSKIISEQNKGFDALLANAVYFKGRWEDEFSKTQTKKDIFTDRNGKESDIDFMNRTADLKYDDINGIQIIELPYLTDEKSRDMDVSMYLLMSDKSFDSVAVLDDAELSIQYVDLSVPKFEIEYDTGLVEILKYSGIKRAFSNSAEFEGMFDRGNMCISDAVHKTYIKIDEEGTEAAAVTAIMMNATAIGPTQKPKPVIVKFNKPFTFVVKDNTNGEILFMGEYAFVD